MEGGVGEISLWPPNESAERGHWLVFGGVSASRTTNSNSNTAVWAYTPYSDPCLITQENKEGKFAPPNITCNLMHN